VEEDALALESSENGGVGVSPHFLNPALGSFLAQRM